MIAPDLQALFGERILEQVELDSGFADHGSSVYRVRTPREHAVARAFREESAASPFWRCLRMLFGIDPLIASEAAAIYPLLADVSPFGVPRVRRAADAGGRTWLVVDLMPGAPLGTFEELSDAGLVGLGRGLASIHGRRFATLGNPSGSMRFAPSELPQRLARAMDAFAGAHREAPVPDHLCDDLRAAIARLPPPAGGALVLPDLFPPQLLQRDGHVVAIVDLDAYVVGPRELDLVGLEYFVDGRAAALVATGYEEVAPLPPLRDVRRAYRWLLWVLTMNPMALDVERWLAWPEAFA